MVQVNEEFDLTKEWATPAQGSTPQGVAATIDQRAAAIQAAFSTSASLPAREMLYWRLRTDEEIAETNKQIPGTSPA